MGAVEQEQIEPQEKNKATFYVFVSCNGPLHKNEQGQPAPWHTQSPPVSFGPLLVGPPRERGDQRPLQTEQDDIAMVQKILKKLAHVAHHEACPSCPLSPTISPLFMKTEPTEISRH